MTTDSAKALTPAERLKLPALPAPFTVQSHGANYKKQVFLYSEDQMAVYARLAVLAASPDSAPAQEAMPAREPDDVHRDRDAAAEAYELEYWSDLGQRKADKDAARGALQPVGYYVGCTLIAMKSSGRVSLATPPAQEAAATQQPDNGIRDAYEGAREDLLGWKRRALEAEQVNRNYARALNEENGSTFMGEPDTTQQPVTSAAVDVVEEAMRLAESWCHVWMLGDTEMGEAADAEARMELYNYLSAALAAPIAPEPAQPQAAGVEARLNAVVEAWRNLSENIGQTPQYTAMSNAVKAIRPFTLSRAVVQAAEPRSRESDHDAQQPATITDEWLRKVLRIARVWPDDDAPHAMLGPARRYAEAMQEAGFPIAPEPAQPQAAGVEALAVAIDALEVFNRRPRPMCRDCADNDGTCPSSGRPCDMGKCIADARAAIAALAPKQAAASPEIDALVEDAARDAANGYGSTRQRRFQTPL